MEPELAIREARELSEPGELAMLLTHRFEQVRAEVVRNPATPLLAIRALARRPDNGFRVLAALVLSPALADEERRKILVEQAQRMATDHRVLNSTGRGEYFWDEIGHQLELLARTSRSAAVLDELAAATDERLLEHVAKNSFTAALTRRRLQTSPRSRRVRLAAYRWWGRKESAESDADWRLAGALRTVLEVQRDRVQRCGCGIFCD
jgi:hypothetical protein